jgi:hypothetical protein
MKFRTGAIFWAVALVSAASYIVCAGLVALAPEATTQVFGWVMHIDLSSLARPITWLSFFGGMLCYSFLLGILAWASACAYNRLIGAKA